MLRGLTLTLTLLVLAPSAGAQTYNGRADVGSAIAGDSVGTAINPAVDGDNVAIAVGGSPP